MPMLLCKLQLDTVQILFVCETKITDCKKSLGIQKQITRELYDKLRQLEPLVKDRAEAKRLLDEALKKITTVYQKEKHIIFIVAKS